MEQLFDTKKRKFILASSFVLLNVAFQIIKENNKIIPRPRRVNANRIETILFINNWSREMFRRQFRLCLEDFKIVLDKIYSDIAPNEKMSRVASCGGMGVTAELKLLITLRILAGGSTNLVRI